MRASPGVIWLPAMINAAAVENILAIACAYAEAEELALSTVSKRFHGKQRFFDELRDGDCTVSLKKLDSMVKEFGATWPRGARWPDTRPITMRRPRRSEISSPSRPQVSGR